LIRRKSLSTSQKVKYVVKEVERKVVAQGGKETRRLPLSPLCPMPDKLLDAIFSIVLETQYWR